MTLLLPMFLGCAHITAISAPASGDFYVVVERYVPPPLMLFTAGVSVPQGYVLHCRDAVVDRVRETRCTRVLDHTQVIDFAPREAITQTVEEEPALARPPARAPDADPEE